MDLYYNFLVLEPLEHGLHTMMNTNALKIILFCYFFSSFLSFIVSFQHIKSQKYIKLLLIMSPIYLYNNHFILGPL
jgi:uncharacterized membrane protein YesL